MRCGLDNTIQCSVSVSVLRMLRLAVHASMVDSAGVEWGCGLGWGWELWYSSFTHFSHTPPSPLYFRTLRLAEGGRRLLAEVAD